MIEHTCGECGHEIKDGKECYCGDCLETAKSEEYKRGRTDEEMERVDAP